MKRMILVGLVVAALAAVGVPTLAVIATRRQMDADLQEQLRLARAEGLPTTAAEYAATVPTARPEENAAPFYKELRGIAKLKPNGTTIDYQLTFHPSSELLAQANDLLRSRARYLEAVDRATAKPKCCFERDWSQAMSLVFPEDDDMKCAARLIALRGSVAASGGDAVAALADMDRLRRMADHSRMEGSTIGELNGLALYRIAMSHLAFWSFVHRDEPIYAQTLKRMLDTQSGLNLKSVYRSDLSDYLWLIDQCSTPERRKQLGLEEKRIAPTDLAKQMLYGRQSARIRFIRDERSLWAALDHPPKDRAKAIGAAQRILRNDLKAFPIAYRVCVDLGALPDATPPNLDAVFEAHRQRYIAAGRALSQPTIPVHIATDDLPSPFDGKPLQYSYDGRQIVIYVSGHETDGKRVYLKIPPDSVVKPHKRTAV